MSDGLFDMPAGTVLTGVIRTASLSDCGTYRYRLTRRWDDDRPSLGFVMLNPSTADHTIDDPTIRRCIGFAKTWGYGAITVRNLYALRATDPKEVLTHPDPVGPLNDDELALAAYHEPLTVLAWGANAPGPRSRHVAELLWRRSLIHETRLAVLGWTKTGHPRHPLYVPAATPPEYCDEGELFNA